MWKFGSKHKAKKQSPALDIPETAEPSAAPKPVSRTPTQASTSTFEVLSAELERTQLLDTRSSSPASRSLSHSRSRSGDRSSDPLGLSVIYEPETSPSLDIIFVHGLGGTSRATWCHNRDPEFFWPQKWLPSEPDIQTARILSFGYNAHFAAPGPTPFTGISDFAKDLLFGMKFAKNERLDELGIGERPIIFIVHSMGGLVVKKAYILGQNSGDYRDIVSSTKAILFLATPHRGTQLAELLNRILSVSIFSRSPKHYVAEMSSTSQTLEDLNDQFRSVAPKLQIISFYETLPTTIGPKKILVLEKSSSILGYPTESSKSLHADHHHVCKYKSVQDPNYVTVRNALKTVVSTLLIASQRLLGIQGEEQLGQLGRSLAITEAPSEDLAFLRKRWTMGTCEWILSNSEYLTWTSDGTDFRLLWLHALPATGKSILSSFIVHNLLERQARCAYYFVRFGDQNKYSLSTSLRSLAFQIAEQMPSFRKALHKISKTGVKLEKADARMVWQKVYVSVLFKMKINNPLYVIIDGLDEVDSPRLLIELIQSIPDSFPIRVIIVSRRTPELTTAFDRLATTLPFQQIALENNEMDIRQYAGKEIDFMHAPPDLKSQIVQKLMERANGNFLWVNLALNEILQCHSPLEIEETLEGLPSGMEDLYHRMELSILGSTRPRDQELSKTILMWATCSRRPLKLAELEQALRPEFPAFIDFEFTVGQVTGQFVIINSSQQILLVHQTAREYLMRSTESRLAVPPAEAHETIFSKCMYFLDQSMQPRGSGRRKSSHLVIEREPFLQYAATSWPYHLEKTFGISKGSLQQLIKFLRGTPVLTWISLLAELGRVNVLVHASRALNGYVRLQRNKFLGTDSSSHMIQDLGTVELWARDLIKILGKFGPNLTRNPSYIHQKVAPFCPRDSIIYKQFGQNESGLSVDGITGTSWDDKLAQISLGSSSQAVTVCSVNQFAVLMTSGHITLYSTVTFDFVHKLDHGERVSAISFSHGCDQIVSSGFHTTKVWSVATGKLLLQIPNPARTRALEIVFSANDQSLLSIGADRTVRIASLSARKPLWSIVDQSLLREKNSIDRTVTNTPCCVSFSPEKTHVAVGYRNFPFSVWNIDPPELVSRCRRNTKDSKNLWAPVDSATWHPLSGEILGIYLGGHIFKWHPFEGTHQEIYASASVIACSLNGKVFATGDGGGSIKLYDYDHFSLMYQLSCDQVVNDISFSPDSRRLYDLHGQFCNVWEPNALLRLDEMEEQDSLSEVCSEPSSFSTAETVTETRDAITAVSVQPGGSHFATGDESGVVRLVKVSDALNSQELSRSRSMLTIEHLDWGADGQHLACAELGGKITVIHLAPPHRDSDGQWTVKSVFDVKVEIEAGGIQQIMLNADCTCLLVGNRSSANILSLGESSSATSQPFLRDSSAARWIQHPTDPRLLLLFSLDSIRIYTWHDLTQIAIFENIRAELKRRQAESRPPLTRAGLSDESVINDNRQDIRINRLLAISTGSHIIFQYTHLSRLEKPRPTTLIFNTSSFNFTEINIPSDSTSVPRYTVNPIPLPTEAQDRLEIPLEILPEDRLIYLDPDFNMCSLRLDSTMNGVLQDKTEAENYFFLPQDWLNGDCLELCRLLDDGTFLIPRNGEVAIVRSGVMLEW